MIATLLVLALSLPALSEADRLARVAYFDSKARPVYLAACTGVLPGHAAGFERRNAKWLRDNAALVRRGFESFRDEAGEDFVDEPLPIDEARDEIAKIIRKLPPEERVAWCEDKL